MKTYCIIYALVAFVIISCSKTGEVTIAEENETLFNADYALLLASNGILSSQLINATESRIDLNPGQNTFTNTQLSEISFRKGHVFGFYQKLTDCSGRITLHNFQEDSSQTFDVFSDLGECNLTATSLAFEGDKLYVSYMIEETSKINRYFVRTIDMGSEEGSFTDVELDKKPLQMVFTNNRLFVLTFDLEITDENALSIVDGSTQSLMGEIGLGYDAERIFVDTDGNLIISYLELHTVLNSSTLTVEYISYEDGKEPKFHASNFDFFDDQGKLYYKMPTDSGIHQHIPAIYDFANNLAVLYYYENILTESQLEFEFKIGDTTMVSYDEENNILLVGYQKMDDGNKGGLLRIQLEPELEFLDNLDLAGVPYQIFYP